MVPQNNLRHAIWVNVRGALIVVGVIVGFLVAVFGIADFACNSTIEKWSPMYPNAEVIHVEYNFLRPRGMGVTYMVLHSPDDAQTVRDWYVANLQRLTKEDAGRGSGTNNWDVDEDPSGQGSLIYLSSRCGQ